jgi:glycine betaine/proline transport system ATP-binding protein
MAIEGELQISTKGLWKVYGKNPKRVLHRSFKNLSSEEIHKKVGCIVALRNVDLKIKRGEFFILMGLSGSGKSTLLRALIHLVKPTAGTVTINREIITELPNDRLLQFRRETFGMVFQHYGLFPHLTVLDNAAYGLKVKGLSKELRYEEATKALATVGLTDPLIRRQMQDELVELQDRLQKTIVFVTHDLHEALKLGERIAIIRGGEIVQIGSPEEIVRYPADSYVAEFVKDASLARVLTASSVMEPAKILLYGWEGPKTAITLLRSNKRKAAFVVDKQRKLLGVAKESVLEKLLESDAAPTRIPREAIQSVVSVTPETCLEDIFPLVLKNPFPVPVVDTENRFQGIVTTDLIFESVSHGENNG